MANNCLKREVLSTFKALHKARKEVFNGDIKALTEGRKKINEEFKKHKDVAENESIQEFIDAAKAAEHELRSCVIQAVEISPGLYQAEIRKDTPKLDNVMFKEMLIEEKCCQDSTKNSKENSDKKCSNNAPK